MAQGLKSGEVLQSGKYRIIRFISNGGFGCTYEAEHVMLEKKVAIKEFFVKDFCNRDETTAHVTVGTLSKKGLVSKLKKKFVDEAKALCRLSHSGIVHVSDVFEENGTAYFVMDYVDGKPLNEIVKIQGPLSEKRALRYIEQVCDALKYIHSNNRLHLDIKPSNIMIDGNDNAVLIDFGASKQYDEESGENTSTLMGKTPGYAPPEQMSNKVQQFTPATDIYALGATLYKLLSGNTPPDASDRIAGEELTDLPDNISKTTREAVNHALVLNKKSRQQSIDDFYKELHSNEDKEITVVNIETKPIDNTKETLKTNSSIVKQTFKEMPKVNPELNPVSPVQANSTSKQDDKAKKLKWIIVASITVIAMIGGVALWLAGGDKDAENTAEQNQQSIAAKSQTSALKGSINGHDYVDLGLPSGLKWATCNVGADSPGDYGDYYAWGETSPKSSYTPENSITYVEVSEEMMSAGIIDSSENLARPYDAARANWGGSWRMPTKNEMEELKNKCRWAWSTQNGHNGYRLTGPNGKCIFLPAAGWREINSLYDVGKYCSHWLSTNSSESITAYFMNLSKDYRKVGTNLRFRGMPIRPVSE